MAESIKFNNDVYIDPSGIKHTIINLFNDDVQAVVGSKIYTGLSVNIPAKSEYMLNGRINFANSSPNSVSFTNSSSSEQSYSRFAYGIGSGVSVCGYTDVAITLYFWGEWNAAGSNDAWVNGVIRTYG